MKNLQTSHSERYCNNGVDEHRCDNIMSGSNFGSYTLPKTEVNYKNVQNPIHDACCSIPRFFMELAAKMYHKRIGERLQREPKLLR